jgi:uncharacterized protein YfaS (alpha-2-macroglobulin family)
MRQQSLNVRTSQTFGLLMPEYSLVRETLSAFGGDGLLMEAAMAPGQGMLNPFRRQAERSVVYWSGIVDVDTEGKELSFTVPSHFNGSLRVMAVAVGLDGVSSNSRNAIVRGDIIISPDLPVAAAPGDEFYVTIAVTNNIEGSGEAHGFSLALDPGSRLQIVGEAPNELVIDEGREGRATVRLRALDNLGEGVLGITAASLTGAESASRPVTVSVRPATPRMSAFDSGRIAGSDFTYTIQRSLHEEYGSIQASVSALPVPIMDALSTYLLNYPFGCTEQILSAAFPYVILHKNPDLLFLPVAKGGPKRGPMPSGR